MEKKLTKAYRKAYHEKLIKRVKRDVLDSSPLDDNLTSVDAESSPTETSAEYENLNLTDSGGGYSMTGSSNGSTTEEVSSDYDNVEHVFTFFHDWLNSTDLSERLVSNSSEPRVRIHNIISGLPKPEIEMLYTVYQGM